MNYQTIQIYNLMANEFAQVEGDFLSLRESDIKSVMPSGMRCSDFLEQLRSGHQVLLTDTPSIPLLIRERDEWGNQYWRVNPVIESDIDVLAHRAYTARVELVNHGIGSFYSGSVNASVYTEPYVEREPVKLSLKERYAKQCQENHLNSEKTWTMLQERKAQEKAQTQQFSLGWMQVESTQSQQDLWAILFTSDTTTTQKQLVKKYNAHLNEPIRQGEIVILPTAEPKTNADKQKLSALADDAVAASQALARLDEDEIATVNRYFELLDHYASKVWEDGKPSDAYAYTSVGVGAIAASTEKHLKKIGDIIQEINTLYVQDVASASRTSGIHYDTFISKRAKLFKKLDQSLARLSTRGIKVPVLRQVKKALKLSTRSVVHHADEIVAEGVVPNLGKRMANISSGISGAKSVGYVGLLFSAASGLNNVHDACVMQKNGQCGKTTTREMFGFFGGWAGGELGGGTGIVIAIGIVGAAASAPVLAIATVVGAAVGGLVGGTLGNSSGKYIGDVIYEFGESVVDMFEEIF
ncbi:hypothetical protein [Vibrio sp. MEBiC08052]|uniref:hypothetical protein n=1 Tax=Vibrio sp. MEBiC08052 TaxID=1761910 RepID=UPI00074084E7|nr:hypothetical protein [Vibrio sp. MEBiC08052]KUI96987.1 hypothetical protein VRK_38420 [Vibrio sp. MEBiC08052]